MKISNQNQFYLPMKNLLIISLIASISVILFALKPEKEYAVTPAEFGVKYRDVTFDTKDGLTLKGWFFSPKKKSGTCIVISNDGDGNMASMIEIASYFTSAGYNVLTYDYRGYGGSAEFKINNKFVVYPQFAKDLDAAVSYAHKSMDITRVFLYGKGIGAALSIGACSGRRDVQKVIADSPYSDLNSYQKALKDVKNEDVMIPLAYDKLLLEPIYALAGKYAKTSKYLLINGDDDAIFTTKSMKTLAKVNKTNVEIHSVKKATYSNTFSKDKAAYFEVIKSFVK